MLKKVAHLYEVSKGGVTRLPIFMDEDGYCWTWDDPGADQTLCECAPWHVEPGTPVEDVYGLGCDPAMIERRMQDFLSEINIPCDRCGDPMCDGFCE